MGILREYASGIIVISVLAILLENLLPNTHHKKYINVVIGLVVMLVIVGPLTKLPHYQESFFLPETVIDDSDLSETNGKKLVAEEFKRRLAETLSSEVQKSCAKKVTVSVEVSANENGEITGIEEISVFPLDEEIRKILAQSAGVAEEKIREGREGGAE